MGLPGRSGHASRIGALRLRDEAGGYLRTVEPRRRSAPALVELIPRQVTLALAPWRAAAQTAGQGKTKRDPRDFSAAFEHPQRARAKALIAR